MDIAVHITKFICIIWNNWQLQEAKQRAEWSYFRQLFTTMFCLRCFCKEDSPIRQFRSLVPKLKHCVPCSERGAHIHCLFNKHICCILQKLNDLSSFISQCSGEDTFPPQPLLPLSCPPSISQERSQSHNPHSLQGSTGYLLQDKAIPHLHCKGGLLTAKQMWLVMCGVNLSCTGS